MYNKLNPYEYCIQEDTTNLTRLVFVEILKNHFNLGPRYLMQESYVQF